MFNFLITFVKMKKLSFKKEIISNLSNNEMNKVLGGTNLTLTQDPNLAMQTDLELEWWGSRINCGTNFEPGGDCNKSHSCNGGQTFCF